MRPSSENVLTALCPLVLLSALVGQDTVTINRQDDGYRGIWYFNQKSNDVYVYKYSGGLGTYCAKHQPFAVYRPQVEKTFFCYGGTTRTSFRKLHHMVGFFDHRTGKVSRPTILLDKKTGDAHDNPVLAIDDAGYVWVFSTSHGRGRPSYIHRSVKPYDIAAFTRVPATYDATDSLPAATKKPGSATPSQPATPARRPITNFSYFQAWHLPGQGFACFFTRYGDPVARTSMFMTSPDGTRWSQWTRLAAIGKGHYQISAASPTKAAAVFNYHPTPKGLNWRTNLYYLETEDLGKTWQTVTGETVAVPVTQPDSIARVFDYEGQKRLVYLKDLRLDAAGHPVVLFLTSKGYRSGPENGPREWVVARWNGTTWTRTVVTTSDNNYDMGSLFCERDGKAEAWRVIGPTSPGPQRFNPGGEVVMWVSRDGCRTFARERALTRGSSRNHTYVRRPVAAHPDFYALWADGHGREPSASRLYFATRGGKVYQLPERITGELGTPIEVTPKPR